MAKDYDTTVARIAGNIASGLMMHLNFGPLAPETARISVRVAKAIVEEIRRSEKTPTERDEFMKCKKVV